MDKYSELEFSVLVEISKLANLLQYVMDLGMKDITSKQWLPLMILGQFEEAPTLNQLAEKCGITRQSMKQLVDKLYEKELIEITKDENDRRSIRISITEKGRKWGEQNFERNSNFVKILFHDISNEELNTFYVVQNKLLSKLNEIKEDFLKGD